MEGASINYLAVVAASLIGFAVGFVWYGPLFGKAWMEETGMTEEKIAEGNMAKTMGLSFVFQLVMAFCLAMFFFGTPEGAAQMTVGSATFYGFLTGAGWILPAFAISGLFEQHSWKLIFIHGFYWVIVFTLMGLVLGLWR